MRKFGEYDLKKLSDSRMLYMRNPPKFVYALVAIIIVVLAGTIVWSAVTVKAQEVQVAGIIVSEDKQILYAGISGTISNIGFKEGDEIGAGDVIAEFDKTAIDLAIQRDEDAAAALNKQIECIDTMREHIVKGDPSQPFSQSPDEIQYYYMFRTYLSSFDSFNGNADLQNNLNDQMLSQLTSQRSTLLSNLTSTQAELNSYKAALSNYDVTAAIPGILHFDAPVVMGMMLQAGTQIGSISNPSADKMIEMYVTAGQRAKIDAGQECRFVIDGLAQTEYGSIRGTVRSISSDAILQNNGAYFRVLVDFDSKYIEDSKGGRINITNGMTVRAWVTYEKVTYLKYWMEQLGLGKYF